MAEDDAAPSLSFRRKPESSDLEARVGVAATGSRLSSGRRAKAGAPSIRLKVAGSICRHSGESRNPAILRLGWASPPLGPGFRRDDGQNGSALDMAEDGAAPLLSFRRKPESSELEARVGVAATGSRLSSGRRAKAGAPRYGRGWRDDGQKQRVPLLSPTALSARRPPPAPVPAVRRTVPPRWRSPVARTPTVPRRWPGRGSPARGRGGWRCRRRLRAGP